MAGAGQAIIDGITAEATNDVTVMGSATKLINGFQAAEQAAIDQALANGATAAQLAPLIDLNAQLKASASDLAAAVAANTPGA